ncbi:hypothetical protein IG631_24051 [Alternaria alternata]|nr:hypothetical protein IG631_24051 [Alternaria alternata]
MCRLDGLCSIVCLAVGRVYLTPVELEGERDHLGGGRSTTCLELDRAVAGKRMRIEWMRLEGDKSALVGSLKSSIYLFVITTLSIVRWPRESACRCDGRCRI